MKIVDIGVKLIHHVGGDVSVVNAARVSFNKEVAPGALKEGDKKLLAYLAKNKHHSPFNHAFLTFRVTAPIYVARQLVKHKFMPWNEVSRRYVSEEPEFYFPTHYRKAAENVKQGSSEEVCPKEVMDGAFMSTHNALMEYNDRIKKGVCPEQARDCLPMNTITEWYWSGTLGAFIDMLILRLAPHSQKESQIVAKYIQYEMSILFPEAMKAYGIYQEIPDSFNYEYL